MSGSLENSLSVFVALLTWEFYNELFFLHFFLIYREMKKALPKKCFFRGALKGTRTPDLLVRSQSLYPTELSAHSHIA